VTYDALVVAGGSGPLDPKLTMIVQEAYRHHKTLAARGSGVDALAAAAIDVETAGVVTGGRAVKGFIDKLIDALGWHRHWER